MNFSGAAFLKARDASLHVRRPHKLNARSGRRFFLFFRAPASQRSAIAHMPISATGCAFGQLAMLAPSSHSHETEAI
jgi:hypothetical protein